MPLLTKAFLRMVAKEGVSVNGSEGLGGRAEGFEQQNQGVVRRSPGEGPKVNGGRAQSQELDTFTEEMSWLGGGDAKGWDRQIAMGNTSGGTDVADDSLELKEMFGDKSIKLMWAPESYGTDGRQLIKAINDGSNAGRGVFLKLGQAGGMALVKLDQEEAQFVLQKCIDFVQTERKFVEDVSLAEDVIEQIEKVYPGDYSKNVMTGDELGESRSVDDMKKMIAQIRDPRGMKDVHARMKSLAKSSEKEKSEHPWATDKQAVQIAKDHEKLGEQLRRTFIFKEAPVKYYSGGSPFDLNSPGGGGEEIEKPKHQRPAYNKQTGFVSTSKPTIEEAHGEFVCVVQFYHQDFVNKNLDEIPEPLWKESGAWLSEKPAGSMGYVSYLVGEDGTLSLHSAHWDSSD